MAKSLPRILSSSPISATMKSQVMTCAPSFTASLARPRQSSAQPSTEHSRPQYFIDSSLWRPHCLQIRAGIIETPDMVSTKKLTAPSPICPGRYSPFPTINASPVAAPPADPASTVTAVTLRCLHVYLQLWSGTLVQNGPSDDRCDTPCQPFFVGWTPGAPPTVSVVLNRL